MPRGEHNTRTVRRYWRWIYAGWFGLIAGLIVLQFYLAGYGVFQFNGEPPFGGHRVVGDVIGIAILLGIGLGFAVRVPWRLTVINSGLFVLMFIQGLLPYTGLPAISALHVVNGLIILGGTAQLLRLAIQFARVGSAPTMPAASGSPAPAKELIAR